MGLAQTAGLKTQISNIHSCIDGPEMPTVICTSFKTPLGDVFPYLLRACTCSPETLSPPSSTHCCRTQYRRGKGVFYS